MKQLKNKVAVVPEPVPELVGLLSIQLAQHNAKLAINDWNPDTLEATKQFIEKQGGTVLARSFDISNRDAVYQFAEEVASTFGQIDIMINNAGIALPLQSLAATSYEDFEKVININMWGMIYGSKAFIPFLQSRPEAALVNVSSIFGAIGYYHQGPYVTAKFAIRGFTETLRQELSDTIISVSVVMPGGIKTNIVRNIDIPPSHKKEKLVSQFDHVAKTTAEAAAKKIIKGIQKKRGRILIGSDAKLIDRIVRLLPVKYDRFILARHKKSTP